MHKLLTNFKISDPYKRNLLICTLILLSQLLFFFPSFYTTTDEREYIENAYLLTQQGAVKYDAQCFGGAYCGYFNGDGFISKYNLGLSFILAPVINIDWKISFLVIFIFFIGALLVFQKILKNHGLNSKFIYLFAFFPPFVYYSKKVMTEIPSMSLTLLIYYLLFETKHKTNLRNILAGVLMGLLVLLKYTNALIVGILLIYYVIKHFKEFKKLLKNIFFILIGATPIFIIFLSVNLALYGSPFRSGYYFSHEELLIIPELIIPQFLKYSAVLLVMYPLMLIVFLLDRNKKRFIAATLLLAFLIYFSPFPAYEFNSGILDFIFASRLFIPIVGVILFFYFSAIQEFISKFRKSTIEIIFIIVALLLIANSFIMTYIFNNRLGELVTRSQEIYETLPENGSFTGNIEDRKLINDAFKKQKIWFYPDR